MKGQRCWGMVVACLFFLPSIALAQVTASVVGTVQDTSGAVIPGAAVTVKNLETGAARTATADERGSYRALSLPVGRYEVSAEKTGFKTAVRTGINLVVGQEAVVNLSLEVGEVQQAVTVTAEAPIVNTTMAATSGLVGERQVKDLPLNGRSFDNLITLNPGTTNMTSVRTTGGTGNSPGAEFSVAGRRNTDNMFLLNGIEYAAASSLGATPGGASGQLLGIDAIREFNVQAHTYGAEYGKRAGGQISIVTMSGTNQFHGSVFEFLRNSHLDARNFFDKSKPAFRRNNFGGSAGGPIRKDKTFIFANYEGYRQALTTTNVVFVPDANARLGFLPTGPGGSLVNVGLAPGMAPYFAIWPQPNGPELGGGIALAYALAMNPVQEDFGTARVDHFFSERDSLSGAYTVDNGHNTTPSVDPLAGTFVSERMQVASLEETHTFSPSLLNTVRLGFTRGGFIVNTAPLISLPPSISVVAGQPLGQVTVGGGQGAVTASALSVFGGPSQNQPRKRTLFTYSDSLQIVKGKHMINVGASFQRLHFDFLQAYNLYGGLTFSDLPSFLAGKPSTLVASLTASWEYVRQWEGAWYVTDAIKLSPRLTMSLGLRHEFTNGWNVHPGPANYLLGPGGVIQTHGFSQTSMFTENNEKWLFAPRVGLAWDPFGNGKTSVHAGFGTYYSLLDDLAYAVASPQYFQVTGVQLPTQLVLGQPLPPNALPKPHNLGTPDAKAPAVEEWSFMVEQQITPSTAISVGYVGSHGVHFLMSADMNPANSVICSASLNNCPAGIPAGTKYYPAGAPRLNPGLGSTTSWLSVVNTSYNSLQVDLKQRLTRGLTLRANYSFSKALDDGSEQNASFMTNCPAFLMEFVNPRRDYGPTCYDIAHRFTFSGSYDLPMGQGRAFFGGVSGAAGKLLSGWKLNSIITAQSGLPFTPTVGFNSSRDGDSAGADRPNVNPNFSGPVILGTPNRWFNPSAFVLPTAGTYGNLGRGTLRGPGLTDVDLSLFKDTRLSERTSLQFRAESFNILNHANFGIPGTSLFSQSGAVVGSAGVINATSTTSRQIQLGLKLIW